MNIAFGARHAAPHALTTRGAFEWWYVDALDAQGEWGIVVIVFDGSPMAPDYVRAIRTNNAGPQEFPAHFCAVYHRGVRRFAAYQLLAPGSLAARGDAATVDVTVGDLSLTLDFMRGTGRIRGALASKLGFRRVELDLAIERITGCADRAEILTLEDSTHTWNPIWPAARVHGRLALDGTAHTLEADGYVDHNFSAHPLHEEAHPWYWGRARAGDRTLVWYTWGAAADTAFVGEWRGDDSLASASDVHVEGSDWRRIAMGLRYAGRLDLKWGSRLLRVEHRRIIDYGPFYLRFLATLRDERGAEHAAVAEYMHPRRVAARFFHVFVNMRVDRSRRRAALRAGRG